MTSDFIKKAVKKVANNTELGELIGADEEQVKQAVETKVKESAQNIISEIANEPSDPDPLFWLKKINKFLEGVPKGIVEYFDNLKNLDLVQEQVDKICEYAAWKVNICVERLRQQVIKALQKQCKQVKDILKFMNTLKKAIENPLNLIEAVAQLLKILVQKFLGPYYELVKFLVQLSVEVSKLAQNLQRIMEVLPPSPPTGSINYDKFILNIGTISMDMIMGDGGDMQNPEAMFPEPEKPFNKETFKKAYNKVKEKTDSIVYRPKVVDKTSGGSTNSDLA